MRDERIPSAAPTRQQFHSLDELVDLAFFQFDSRSFSDNQQQAIRAMLRQFGITVIDEFSHSVEKGTARALIQTAEVFQDPQYYIVTKKQRAAKLRKQQEKWRAEREQRERQYLQPETPTQIAAKRRHLTEMVEFHERQAAKYKEELKEFENSPEIFRAAALKSSTKGIM